ncbi:pyridoxine 5'-phosphate synthase [Longimicrobium sp.]|uniref:pyridoxine 5'-phosphate synthase n=1 Tax=Longimicrobium sp. TaxID=2029185 RepID=UPI002F922C22
MTRLSVNLNKIALLRNARATGAPSVARAANQCLDAGAHGITLHPRPDQRHVRPGDVEEVAEIVRLRGVELNVEGYPSREFISLVTRVRPAQCTLVPDAPDQRTSDHGWDFTRPEPVLRDAVATLRGAGVRVSLFADPDPEHMPAAASLGAECVELYTGPYAAAFHSPARGAALDRYAAAAASARRSGLAVHAGHDLNLENLAPFCARVGDLAEVSIGHALVADALDRGLSATVAEYLRRLPGAGPRPESLS